MGLPARFWDKVKTDYSTGCWLWLGALTSGGYGALRWEGKMQRAHRVVYTLLVGTIPSGLQLDHKCRTRRCVNPEHLEPVTSKENTARGTHKIASVIRTNICLSGHEFTEENTLWINSRRRCKTCKNARYMEWYYRNQKAQIQRMRDYKATMTKKLEG